MLFVVQLSAHAYSLVCGIRLRIAHSFAHQPMQLTQAISLQDAGTRFPCFDLLLFCTAGLRQSNTRWLHPSKRHPRPGQLHAAPVLQLLLCFTGSCHHSCHAVRPANHMDQCNCQWAAASPAATPTASSAARVSREQPKFTEHCTFASCTILPDPSPPAGAGGCW